MVKKGTRFIDRGVGFYGVASKLRNGEIHHGIIGFSSDSTPSRVPDNLRLNLVSEGDANLYGLQFALDRLPEYSVEEE